MKKIKIIFVAGGVMSSVGKGIASASIGKILEARGFKVTAIKIDPYVNVDAGTMNPVEHGEVFVLKDGTECDQDMGNYERFLDLDLSGMNYMTTGSIYLSVIERERNLEYGGRCVHVVPDIPLEVLSHINQAAKKDKAEIVIVEIGGTVGDYQNVLFLEAVRMQKFRYPKDTLLILVSFVPSLENGGNELKTKPTQHAVRNLNSVGIHPDFILARAKSSLDNKRREKLEYMLCLEKDSVFSAPDVDSIYDVPLNFEKEKIDERIMNKLHLKPKGRDLKNWKAFVSSSKEADKKVTIGIVGKYFSSGSFVLTDSYISVLESIKHAAYSLKTKPIIEWIDSSEFESDKAELKKLSSYSGIIVPGGFGSRGIEGKINVIRYCRENKIPYLGLCYGMQLMTIEFARSVAGLSNANTTEVAKNPAHPVIDILPEQKKNLAEKKYGATMRLGTYDAVIAENTLAKSLYGKTRIQERHRHRYEVNPDYIERLTKAGLVFSGRSPDGRLMEIAELPHKVHPFFIGSQFHPELQSRPLSPHPIFVGLIKACL